MSYKSSLFINRSLIIAFTLTCLVGRYGDDGVLPHCHRHSRDAVLRLHLEGVVGVGQQVGHRHRGVPQARRPWQETHVATAGLAAQNSSYTLMVNRARGTVIDTALSYRKVDTCLTVNKTENRKYRIHTTKMHYIQTKEQ